MDKRENSNVSLGRDNKDISQNAIIEDTDIINIVPHKRVTYIEIDARTIHKIRRKANEVGKDHDILSNILLGLSTTFLGIFLNIFSEISYIIEKQKFTLDIIFDIVFLFVALILFAIWFIVQRTRRLKLEDLFKEIEYELQELDIMDNKIDSESANKNYENFKNQRETNITENKIRN